MRDLRGAWAELARSSPAVDVDAHRPAGVPDEQWVRHLDQIVRPMAELVRRLDPIVLGLSGVPGSGKTTLARQLTSVFDGSAHLSTDDFYLSRAEREARGLRFRGAVGSHDLPALIGVLNDVRGRRSPITIPRYDTHADDRGAPETLETPPRPLVLEGYFLGYDRDGYGEVADLLDLLIFIDVEMDAARTRRFEREAMLREQGGGLTEQEMQNFWDDVLLPGIEQLVPRARAAADIVLVIDDEQTVRRVEVDDRRLDIVEAMTRTLSGPDVPSGRP